jgi:TonB family protein
LRASLGWQSKSNSLNESEMALFYECMPKCARKLLDTADIVRDAIFQQTTCLAATITAMVRRRADETQYKLRVLTVRLCALGWLFLLVGLPAECAEVSTAAAPIEVSSKEADDNLQVKTLQPEYPTEAKAKGIEGSVRLRVVTNERGNVTDIKALSGDPLLVPSAIALVKRFPYRPFIRGGKRVAVTTDVDVPFSLHPTTQKEIYDSWMSHLKAATQLRKDEKVDAALAELQQALGDAKKLGEIEVADTFGDIADLYSREGRYSDAEPALAQRLDILRRSRIQDELEIANTQADLGTA